MTLDHIPGNLTRPDPLELEVDRLKAEVERLKAALFAAADALEAHGMYIANFPNLDGCDSAHRALRFAVDAARRTGG